MFNLSFKEQKKIVVFAVILQPISGFYRDKYTGW